MNNWLGIYQKSTSQIKIDIDSTLFQNCFSAEGLSIYYRQVDNFFDDQLFYDNEKEIILSDGIILNLAELKTKYSSFDLLDVIKKAKQNQPYYFAEFIGPFSGIYYNKNDKKAFAYGNQTGDAPLFYFQNDDYCIFSNEFNKIHKILTDNAVKLSFDKTAAFQLLTFGYVVEDRTMCNEIKRLEPGHVLLLDSDFCVPDYYAELKYQVRDISLNEAIEIVDDSFRKAVKRCFDKDLEYKKLFHLVDISGGLDSRMTNWVARNMGYDNFLNMNYCQSNSDELDCSSIVSKTLHNSFFHKQLDDLSFVYDIEDLVSKNYGLALYNGLTGGKDVLSILNFEIFGLEHTGQIGDAVLGTFCNGSALEKPEQDSIRYSHTLVYNLPKKEMEKYKNNEEFWMINRGFKGALASHLIRRNYCYTVSPFMDWDFINLCNSIPVALRSNHKLYWAWIDKKYPEAGKLRSTRKRDEKSLLFHIKRRTEKISRQVGNLMGISESKAISNNMNPWEYWYETDEKFRTFVKDYYESLRNSFAESKDISDAIDAMYNSGKVMDKLLVLTVLCAYKKYILNI